MFIIVVWLFFYFKERLHEVNIFFFRFCLILLKLDWKLNSFTVWVLIFFLRKDSVKSRKWLIFFIHVWLLFDWVAMLIIMFFFDLFDFLIAEWFVFLLNLELVWGMMIIFMILLFITVREERLYFFFDQFQFSKHELIDTKISTLRLFLEVISIVLDIVLRYFFRYILHETIWSLTLTFYTS